jgi:hypothetical protein
MKFLSAILILLCTIPASGQAEKTTTMQQPNAISISPTLGDIRAVSPALAQYTQVLPVAKEVFEKRAR